MEQQVNTNDKPIVADFVTAMVKGRAGGFALKGGDACNGTLTTMYDGVRPNGIAQRNYQDIVVDLLSNTCDNIELTARVQPEHTSRIKPWG